MIGILLAIQFDDYREHKRIEKKIDGIIGELQDELEHDIFVADSILQFYDKKDSLVSIIMEGNLTIDDYVSNLDLSLLVLNFNPYEVELTSYDKLLVYSDQMPEKYTTMFEELRTQKKLIKRIDINNSKIMDISLAYSSDWIKRYDWFPCIVSPTLCQEDPYYFDQIRDFYIDNNFYLSMVIQYRSAYSGNLRPGIIQYREAAQQVLKEIDGLTK